MLQKSMGKNKKQKTGEPIGKYLFLSYYCQVFYVREFKYLSDIEKFLPVATI